MQGNWDFYNEAKLKLFLFLAENVKERSASTSSA